MRLISCYIENFGKLHELEIFFDEGESVFYEENGWGKSTLAAFLKVMFYGFDNEGRQDALVNERKRWQPWQKGVYGGRLVFEAGGKTYRLERTFGEKRSGDITELYDQETNRRYDISGEQVPGGNLGRALFGIDSDSFRRSALIRQQDCADTVMTSEISARIGRVSEQTADMGNYQTVRANLEKELNRLTPKRKTGLISRMKAEAAGLEAAVREKEGLLRTLEQIEQETEDLKNARQEEGKDQERLNSELKQFGEKQERRILAEQYQNLLKAEADAKEKVIASRQGFSDRPPSVSEIDERIEQARQSEKLRASLNARREQADLLRSMADSGNDPEEQRKDFQYSVFFLIAGVLLLVLGMILAGTDNLYPGLLLSVLGAVSVGLWWHLKRKGTRFSVMGSSSVEVDGYKAAGLRYERLMKEIVKDEKEVAAMEQQIRSFLISFAGGAGPSSFHEPENVLQELKRKSLNFQAIWENYQQKKAERESFEENHDTVELEREFRDDTTETEKEGKPATLEQITEELNRKQSGIEALSEKIREQDRQEEVILQRLEEIEQTEADLQEKKREIAVLYHRYEIISKTKEYLEQAKLRFSSRYMGTVRTSFNRYYHMIAGNDGTEYEMDAEYNIRIRDAGGLHDAAHLSDGFQDLVGLCRRMAMIDAMYDREKPFLIFDDPFASLDDRRLAGALRFLDLISEEYQVIYFSCSEARLPA